MFTSPSFLALMVAPSTRSNMLRTISRTLRWPWPASRSLIKYAFSAKRQASRKNGSLCLSQIARTPRRFSRLTGWPPPLLFVTVTMTSGICSRPTLRINPSSLLRSMLPLNGWRLVGCLPSSMTRSIAWAPVCSMFARVVSK